MKALIGLFAFAMLIIGIIILLVGIALIFIFPQLEGNRTPFDFLAATPIIIIGAGLIWFGNMIAKSIGNE